MPGFKAAEPPALKLVPARTIASPVPPLAVTAPFKVMPAVSVSRILPPPELLMLLTTSAPELRIAVLPETVLLVVSVETPVSKLIPPAAVSVAVGAVTFTEVLFPSSSAPPVAVRDTELVAVKLSTVKGPLLVIERSVKVVPRLPPLLLKSVVTEKLPVPLTVPLERLSVPVLAVPLNVTVPPETFVVGTL